jgi:hypothetical protein
LATERGVEAIRVVAPTLSDHLAQALGGLDGVQDVVRSNGEWRVRLDRPDATPEVIRWLVAHDVAIEEVRRERASFEQAFLDLVAPGNAEALP